ncbi:hypothetical protein M409DRAFT_49037 [Zasmidium cellare ATCC 36951]|uniref:F-box domain-containing protein n=1 Tax=Zasmidium cellare ATCC 36951 TaxID=1080233 RepID=A0A6A6D785_ZASCE|nr:uncharacterized protein M409DRAFT_49037 [Zasmidium cellare ATCC 36951]KAF2174170.1 hypothetical protein M409DRAFT_49037 [Zasmidium cellare ATCC 36951]
MPALTRRKSTLSLKSTKSRTLPLLRRSTTLRLGRRKKPDPLPIEENGPSSPLLALPPELRNQVYTYCLQLSTRENRIELRNLPIPPLLGTCRQAMQEGISIYFAENYFVWTRMFKHRYRLEEMIVPPLHYLREKVLIGGELIQMGPILDMRLDAWMPWVWRFGGRGMEDEVHRIHLASITRPAVPSNGAWVTCTAWVQRDIKQILRGWRPVEQGGPSFDEVMDEVVGAIWFYHKVLATPGGWPPRMGFLTWVRDKIMKSMDDQDRSWGRW